MEAQSTKRDPSRKSFVPEEGEDDLNPEKEPGVKGGGASQKFILAIAFIGFFVVMVIMAYLLTYGT
jgi:hypothetical protein